jgi:hypothetical protein
VRDAGRAWNWSCEKDHIRLLVGFRDSEKDHIRLLAKFGLGGGSRRGNTMRSNSIHDNYIHGSI